MVDQKPVKAGKDYVRSVPDTWWLKRRTYVLFMVRELTCIFVGGYSVFLLYLAAQSGDSLTFEATLKSPFLIVLQIIALPMVLYHSITWINLTPKVMVIFRGEDRISPTLIAAGNYVAWAVVSGIIYWIACSSG